MHDIFYRIDNFSPNKTYRMLKKYMKRCSTSLSGKCKSKVQQISPHFCWNGFYQKVRNKCCWGCVENGGTNGLLVGMYIGATLMEYLLLSFSWNLKKNCYVAINSHFWIYIHFWICVQKKWNNYLKGNLFSHVHCINIHSSLETAYYRNNLSICQQVKRLKQYDMTYTCEFYLAITNRTKFFHLWQHGWN